ncbi:MAG: YigZ family protein, partial [Peptococcaceae bacterium]|nr:YigZ family protein [Peptococcaceae bacterium]
MSELEKGERRLDEFFTLHHEHMWEQTIEKSRFIGWAYPVASLADVAEGLQRSRALWPAARHYVYAWRLWTDQREKSSDDGEPQGTGGRPVLDALQFKGLWNVLVIVARYFGGVLLGTGGLTRAYGGTARALLNEAQIIQRMTMAACTLHVPYALFETLKYQLQSRGREIAQSEFAADVRLEIHIPVREKESFAQWLREAWHGQ